MGLFARFFGRERDGKGEGGPRCMECGMTEGEHTDWCPLATMEESDTPRAATSEEHTQAESGQQPHP